MIKYCKRLLFALIFPVLLISLWGCFKNETIKIGALLAISSISNEPVVEVQNGMILAIEELNDAGGIHGRKIELLIRDTEMATEKSVKQFLELEKNEKPLLYISTISVNSVAIAPYADKYSAPVICTLTGSPRVTKGYNWMYRYSNPAENEIIPLINMLMRSNYKKIGIINSSEEWGESLYNSFIQMIHKKGLNIEIIHQSYKMGTKDFDPLIDPMINTDGIFILGFSSYYKKISAFLKKKSYKGNIFSTSAVSAPTIRNLPTSDGTYCSTSIFYKSNYKFAEQFRDQFYQRFNIEATHYGARGYDLIMIAASLLEKGEISRQALKKSFDKGFIYTGLLGIVNAKSGSKDFTISLTPAKIVNGKLDFLD